MAGKQCHADKQWTLRTAIDGSARRAQHIAPAECVYVDHPHPEACRCGTGVGDGIRDIVVLEIEKNIEAPHPQGFHHRRPGTGKELKTNLQTTLFRLDASDNT